MSFSGSLKVARGALQSMSRLGLDALLDPLGGTIPLSPERTATPQFLNRLFLKNAVDPALRGAVIESCSITDIKSISSNCNNSVLTVSGVTADGDPVPASMFMKQPAPELLTRAFCSMIRIWELECRFYRDLAPTLPIRTPKAWAVANQGSRFVMLLENLHADPEVQLFTNPDMMKGPFIPHVKQCLSTLARLHAGFHGISADERERLLPAQLHPYTSPAMREISKVIGAASIEPCRKKAPHLLKQNHVELLKKVISHWDSLLGWWYQEPLTLAHGDSHLGNFYLHGNEMGMLDWQAAQWGKGIRDVQYFLIDSLPVEVLAEQEKGLVLYYLSELAEQGVELPFDEAWEQYRAYSFQTFITIVVSLGSGSMVGMDDVMTEILARSIAAIERLEFEEWFDAKWG